MKPMTDSSFIDIMKESKTPILIKFEAKWCQPCKAMTTVLNDIEKQFDGRLAFCSANVEHCMMISHRYKIKQIPALVIVENGAVAAMRTGSGSKQELVKWIQSSLREMT